MVDKFTFSRNIEDLLEEGTGTRKDTLVRYLCKHFKENAHYIKTTVDEALPKAPGGGYKRAIYFVSDDVYELIKSSYNLKHRYVRVVGSMRQVRTVMSLENQTVGFIVSTFTDLEQMERQHQIGPYSVDLCFVEHKIVVECDESGHKDYKQDDKKDREKFMAESGYSILRFDPCGIDFDLSCVIREIMTMLRSRKK